MNTLSIANDFSKWPAGRTRADGEFSAQAFREDILFPALIASEKLKVDLNGTIGFSSAWLQEAFQDVKWDRIEFVTDSEVTLHVIYSYMQEFQNIPVLEFAKKKLQKQEKKVSRIIFINDVIDFFYSIYCRVLVFFIKLKKENRNAGK